MASNNGITLPKWAIWLFGILGPTLIGAAITMYGDIRDLKSDMENINNRVDSVKEEVGRLDKLLGDLRVEIARREGE